VLRDGWGISKQEKLFGLVGRIDPMKDHHTFLKAIAIAQQQNTKARFVCVGNGPKEFQDSLKAYASSIGVKNIIWAGPRNNMPAVYNALDFLVLSSKGEGFPNVVAEAMACGIPCIVTDVGDCRLIVGETGMVVPLEDPVALAQAILHMSNKPLVERESLGLQARQRIVDEFSVEKMVAASEAIFTNLA
jgi:glycosyltransferase involved in cell wall biosynthesis